MAAESALLVGETCMAEAQGEAGANHTAGEDGSEQHNLDRLINPAQVVVWPAKERPGGRQRPQTGRGARRRVARFQRLSLRERLWAAAFRVQFRRRNPRLPLRWPQSRFRSRCSGFRGA